jgi:hypothetical protein
MIGRLNLETLTGLMEFVATVKRPFSSQAIMLGDVQCDGDGACSVSRLLGFAIPPTKRRWDGALAIG